MATILFVWTVVAASNYNAYRDWRPLGEFYSPADCHRGARELGIDPDKFRCIEKGKL